MCNCEHNKLNEYCNIIPGVAASSHCLSSSVINSCCSAGGSAELNAPPTAFSVLLLPPSTLCAKLDIGRSLASLCVLNVRFSAGRISRLSSVSVSAPGCNARKVRIMARRLYRISREESSASSPGGACLIKMLMEIMLRFSKAPHICPENSRKDSQTQLKIWELT